MSVLAVSSAGSRDKAMNPCGDAACCSQAFGPFVFYDTDSKESCPEGSSSLVNTIEVEMVLCVYTQLIQFHPELKGKDSVAVISPYKAQVRLRLLPLAVSIISRAVAVSLL